MGQKTKGDMWCVRCQRHVLAIKNTHPARNTAAVLAMPLTGGLSLAGAGVSDYNCPNCGGPTRRATPRDVDAPIYFVPDVAYEPIEAEMPASPRQFQRDAERDAGAARLVRRQLEEAGGHGTKPVSYLFFRFGVTKRAPGVCEYIEACLTEAGIGVTPPLSDSTEGSANVTLAIAQEIPEAAETDATENDLASDLERLAALFRDGLLTEQEFESAKARLIAS